MRAAGRFCKATVPALRDVTAYGIPVVALVVLGLRPGPTAAALAAARDTAVRALCATPLESLLADPRLAGYHALHAEIGRRGRQFVPAPESLLRVLHRRRAWRSLSPLIDCYNLVALATCVSIGAHDLARVNLPIALDVLPEEASLVAIGEAAPLRLGKGEYVYRDAQGTLLGRLECRQAAHSCVRDDTRDVLFILQGHRALDRESLLQAADVLTAALATYCGSWESAEVSTSR